MALADFSLFILKLFRCLFILKLFTDLCNPLPAEISTAMDVWISFVLLRVCVCCLYLIPAFRGRVSVDGCDWVHLQVG